MKISERRLFWSIFALCLASYAYFYQAGGWNENSRFDLVRSIVEDHSLAIDRFASNTGDKARVGEHYYSDKAPGLSFLAVPIYAGLRLFASLFRNEHDFVVMASYLVTVLTVGAAGALAAALVYRGGRKLGASQVGALLAAVGYALGTPAFPLSTMLFGHQLAALLLAAAFLTAWEAKDAPSSRRSMAVALLCAGAVVVEFPTLPAAGLVGAYHIGRKPSRATWLFLGAAAVPAFALGIYLTSAFGSPISVGYDALSDPASRAEMQSRGFFGLTYPRPAVIAELLIGRHRGLLPYSPILLLAISGFVRALSRGGETEGSPPLRETDRRAMQLALGIIAYFVLFVSSYEWWQGGAIFGSRHLAPMLPLLAIPLALVATARPRLAGGFLVVSVLVMTIVTSVQPKPSERYQSPFWDFELPQFVHGQLAISNACPVVGSSQLKGHEPFLERRSRDAFNLGILLGGSGHKSLVPLLGLWAGAAWGLYLTFRRKPDGEVEATAEVTSRT